MVVAPLIATGDGQAGVRVLGALGAYSATPDRFTDADVAL
jgi:hypothetical protein